MSLAFWMPVLFTELSLCGGDEEIRTLDPLLAGQVLSQLSYTPVASFPAFQGSLSDPENRTTKSVLKLLTRLSFLSLMHIVRLHLLVSIGS